MEKNNQKRSVFESSKNISEYIIEFGNTTYENTLEERILTAMKASKSSKLAQKKCTEEKLSNSRNVKDIHVQNIAVLKSMRSAQIKNKQCVSINKTDVQTSIHVPLLKNITKTKNINSNFESKYNTSLLKPTYKGGCLMQQRLEAIKANKKFSNKISHINDLESNSPSKNVSLQDISIMKNYNSKLYNTNISKRNEYKTRSVVQKHPLEEVKHTGHCDRTENITNTPFSETIVSTKLGNQCILKNSKSKEPDHLNFVRPLTSRNQQTLEHKKNMQFNNDEAMEWEDIETDNIVGKVNDIRRTEHEYEPMEWTPESIMHCDRINYCLVIDTNILLSDLKSITLVIDKYLTDCGYPTIVLPWQVLQELDCIKVGENALGYRAREATRWLCEMLEKCHPRLKGQPMTKKNGMNGDDDILKCAITVKERVNIVYLVTDDNILRIKSEFNGISVKNSRWLQSVVTNTNQNDSKIFQGK